MENCVAQSNSCGLYVRGPEYNMGFSMYPNTQFNYAPRETIPTPTSGIASLNQGNYSHPLCSANNFNIPSAPYGSMPFPIPLPSELPSSTVSFLKTMMSFPYLCQSQNFGMYRNLETGCLPLPAPCFTRPYEPSATLEQSKENQAAYPNAVIHRPKPISILADKNDFVPRAFKPINLISSSSNLF